MLYILLILLKWLYIVVEFRESIAKNMENFENSLNLWNILRGFLKILEILHGQLIPCNNKTSHSRFA